jgi:hypothetical protein
MKNKSIITIGAGLLLTVFIVTGCGTLDALYHSQPVVTPAVTNQVPQITPAVTNQAVIVTGPVTNSAGIVTAPVTNVTITVTPPQTNMVFVVTPAVTNQVLAPNSSIQAGIQAAGALPFPFAGLGAIVLGWLYTAYAAFRNKKVSTALVTGIEAGRQILQSTPQGQALDAKFKDALIQHQDVAGVLNEVSAMVNSLTADTVKPAPQ